MQDAPNCLRIGSLISALGSASVLSNYFSWSTTLHHTRTRACDEPPYERGEAEGKGFPRCTGNGLKIYPI